jgi:integration host factor subunit beta
VTKKEIVKLIAEKFNESQVKVKDIVQETFDLIVDALVKEGRIELRNFGVFEVKRRKPRMARNPRTDTPVEVPAKNVVTFQPGKVMEEKVRSATVVVPGRETKGGAKRPPAPPVADDAEDEGVPVGAAVGAGGGDADDRDRPSVLPMKPR